MEVAMRMPVAQTGRDALYDNVCAAGMERSRLIDRVSSLRSRLLCVAASGVMKLKNQKLRLLARARRGLMLFTTSSHQRQLQADARCKHDRLLGLRLFLRIRLCQALRPHADILGVGPLQPQLVERPLGLHACAAPVSH